MNAAINERRATRVLVERNSVNDDSVVVIRLLAPDGESVAAGQPVLEVETSKSATEIVAPLDGRLLLLSKVGDQLNIGDAMFELIPLGVEPLAMPMHQQPTGSQSAGAIVTNDKAPVLSLAARRAAADHGVAPSIFAAGAWVMAADVMTSILGPNPQSHTDAGTTSPIATAHKVERLSKRKQSEIRNLKQGNAHGSVSSIGMHIAVTPQRLVKPPPAFRDSIADLVIFEGARLLAEFPRLNAAWIDDRHAALFDAVNFGVSFDTGDNLKVLSVRGAQLLSLHEIQSEYVRLLELYESGDRIDEDILASATVTLSDLSSESVRFMQPLLNGRQALILGLTRWARDRYEIFASFDHRVSEGLAVSRYLNQLSQRVASHFREDAGTDHAYCSACRKPMSEELLLGGRGMLNVTLGTGSQGLLCRNCFMGI